MFLVVHPPDTLFLPPSIVPKWHGLRGLARGQQRAVGQRRLVPGPAPLRLFVRPGREGPRKERGVCVRRYVHKVKITLFQLQGITLFDTKRNAEHNFSSLFDTI